MHKDTDQKNTGLKRRDFLKVAGVGAAALAMPRMGFAANAGQRPVDGIPQEEIETDVLIVGGGYAGVFAAIKAREQGANVTIVEKGTIFKSGLSPFARGFSHFDKDKQEPAVLTKINGIIGEYLANPTYLKMWMDGTRQLSNDLESWGFFTQGTNFADIMRQQVVKSGATVIERTMITNLIKKDGRVVGAVGFPMEEDKAIVIRAKAVTLCAGAGTFKSPGFFSHPITFDGDAMAYRIGAEITGKEFVDTHVTSEEYPAAAWRNNAQMEGTNPDSIMVEIENHLTVSSYTSAHTNGHSSSDDARRSGGRRSRQDGDGGGGSSESSTTIQSAYPNPGGGITWRGGGSPRETDTGGREGSAPNMRGTSSARRSSTRIGGASAGLSVHKAEGLFPADDTCGSNIPGLYAAGDALGSMLMGGTYGLGGASSSGSAVQGAVAGETAAKYAKKIKTPKVSTSEIQEIKTAIFEPRQLSQGYSPDWVLQLIQSAMIPYYVLYVKKQDRLEAALANIMFYQEHFAPKLMAEDTHQLRMVHETRNMLLNAEMKLRASLYRTESRANHFREDYPARDDSNWLAWVVLSQEKGKMKLKKAPVLEVSRPDPKIPYLERYPNRFPGELEYVKAHKIK